MTTMLAERATGPKTRSQKATQSTLDTIEFSIEDALAWRLPPFQRPLRVNERVRLLAEQIKADGGVVPGILTFGILGGQRYLIDGQHRREAFLLSACAKGYADVRNGFFDSMADMGEEFVRLNSSLVRMRPDDMLRGMEGRLESLQQIRKACPWIGYDNVRRGQNAPIVSMAVVLRCWTASRTETPGRTGGAAPATMAAELTRDEANNLIGFLICAFDAWGRDDEFRTLWTQLNMGLCMWLYRRTVLAAWGQRGIRLTLQQFKRGIAALSADEGYLDWLTGRLFRDLHRAPAYNRLTAIMAKRLEADAGKKMAFPRPAWALGRKK